MNPLAIACLLCFDEWMSQTSTSDNANLVSGAGGAQGSEATFSGEPALVTGGPASGVGLQISPVDDDELEVDEEVSGGDDGHFSLLESHPREDDKKKRKGKGKKKNRHRSKSTTPLSPEHAFHTDGYASTLSTTEDPCTSTHLSYCIHGYCKNIEGLQEPVCICMKDYDGARCAVRSLTSQTKLDPTNNTELVQTVLVIIAVVLSVISCTAIVLMTCAQSHKHFLASYLGTGTEQEKLQKPAGDVAV